MVKPFRFGLLLQQPYFSRSEVIDLARRAEDDGYDIVLETDHPRRHAPLQVLQAVAEAASVRIGTLVLNNDFRHPVVLAHELATLDVMTEGRLEIGLGAGWSKWEYDDVSMSFDRPGRRVGRLEAAIAMLKQAMSTGAIDHSGSEYGNIRMDGVPKSHQRPHPPLLIGGGGPRLLTLAAREAQIVAIDPRALPEGGQRTGEAAPSVVDEKIGVVRAAAGDRFHDLEINLILFDIDPAYTPGSGRPRIESPHLTDDELLDSPYYLVGDAQSMVDALIARRERWGFNNITVKPEHMEVLAPVVARLAGS